MLSTLPPTDAYSYLDDLTREVDVALLSGCPARIARALRSVQSARAFTIRRFELSLNHRQKRSCLAMSRSLQTLADRCVAGRRPKT